MQVEDVAGVGLTSGRTMQRQGHLAVSDSLLGQVVVDDQHVTAGVVLGSGLAILAVIHEELADCGTGHRSGVCSGSGNNDRVVKSAVLLEGFTDVCNRRCLLADGDVDTNHILAALVQDGVDGDSGLTRLTIANDKLTLATANGDHRVDGEKTGLNRLAHRSALDNARSLELNGARVGGANLTHAIDRLTQRIHDTAEHGTAYRNVHDAAGGAALVAFLDDVDRAKKHGTDLVAVKVLGQTVNGLTSFAALELEQLAGHGATQSGDAGDTVADFVNTGNLLRVNGRRQAVEFLGQRGGNALSIDL